MALFGNSSSGSRSSSKSLVEFRAGKMFMKGTMVNPDKRKGLVYVTQSEDGLVHFCWKDRTSGKVEDDLIIFPDDCEFKKVSQCTTGRVYILKFKASSRKFFFWMQEPKTDKDEDHCKKVNESLNSPPGQAGGSDLSGIEQLGQGNFQDLFQNMDNNQLLQLMAAGGGMGGGNLSGLSSLLGAGGAGGRSNRSSRTQATTASTTRTTARPATTTAATPERASVTPTPAVVTPAPATPATDAASGLQLSQLQNILSQMGVQVPAGASGGEQDPVDLSKALNSDVMIPILANSEVQERLKPFLPQGESLPSTADELKATVKSPQFRQAMASFSEALATGQLGPVLKQFGLPDSAQEAAAKGDVEGFAKAMQESESKPVKEDTEDMVVE